jgi:hypothetical protein
MTFIVEKHHAYYGIDSIFEKDAQGKYYNKKARLFQDILIFGSKINENEPFKLWDLAKFLLENNPELRNHYQGERMRNEKKIENIQRRLKRNIEILVRLRLMKQIGQVKEEKGTGLVPTFSYTPTGYVLSRIVQYSGVEKESAERELYTLFRDRFFKVKEDSPSLIIFASKFIENIYQRGLFGEYVSTFQKVLNSKDISDIGAFAMLIEKLLSPIYQSKYFVNTWIKTIKDLDPDVRRLYMYDQKLTIDRRMGSKALSKEYEQLRLELRAETEKVAFEGVCFSCKERCAISIDIIEYTQLLPYAHIPDFLSVECPKCDSPMRTLELPNILE